MARETTKAQGELDEYMMKKWDHKNNRVVDWLLGACLITRRSALSEVGLLDTRYFCMWKILIGAAALCKNNGKYGTWRKWS